MKQTRITNQTRSRPRRTRYKRADERIKKILVVFITQSSKQTLQPEKTRSFEFCSRKYCLYKFFLSRNKRSLEPSYSQETDRFSQCFIPRTRITHAFALQEDHAHTRPICGINSHSHGGKRHRFDGDSPRFFSSAANESRSHVETTSTQRRTTRRGADDRES